MCTSLRATPSRVYQLIAKTQEAMALWMEHLTRHSLVAQDNEMLVRMEEAIAAGEAQARGAFGPEGNGRFLQLRKEEETKKIKKYG